MVDVETCACPTPGAPVEVDVADTLTGEPEVARIVCGTCWLPFPEPAVPAEPRAPRPTAVQVIARVGLAAAVTGWVLMVGGILMVVVGMVVVSL